MFVRIFTYVRKIDIHISINYVENVWKSNIKRFPRVKHFQVCLAVWLWVTNKDFFF